MPKSSRSKIAHEDAQAGFGSEFNPCNQLAALRVEKVVGIFGDPAISF